MLDLGPRLRHILQKDLRVVPIDQLAIKSITGVDVELPIAGPGGRSYAFVVDWHIRVLLAVGWYLIAAVALTGSIGEVFTADGLTMGASFWLLSLPPTAVYFLYHPLLEWLMNGQTPGKRVAGVRIVNRQGGPPSLLAVVLRNVFRFVDGLPAFYLVGLAATLMTKDQTRIGDLAAGTLLVYEADHAARDREQIERFGQSSRLSLRVADLIRDVLDRWENLEPDVRVRLATELLARMDVTPKAEQAALRRQLAGVLEDS